MIVRTVTANWEPVTLEEAKAHLGGLEGISSLDAMINSLIKTAREMAEEETWRIITESTVKLYLPAFSGGIRLPRPYVQSVQSVTYKNDSGADVTVDADNYTLVNWEEPARLVGSFPSTTGKEGSACINYTAGYASAEAVPGPIKSAMLMIIYHLFDNRGDVTNRTVNEMPKSSKYLLAPYRCFRFD